MTHTMYEQVQETKEVRTEEHISSSIVGKEWVSQGEVVSTTEVSPGIDYTLSACSGRWAYMNDEGSTYITKGYRIGLSVRQCLRSMFQIHNETLNIWSHLLGCLLFFSLCFYVLSSPALHKPASAAGPPARKPVPLCLPITEESVFNISDQNATLSQGECRQADEKHAWTVSHVHFEAAKDIFQLVKKKLPGLKEWRQMLEAHTEGMQRNMAAEAKILQSNLDKAVAILDSSVESIKEELMLMSSASMEGCVVCWAEVVKNLAQSRQTLMEQLASLSKMTSSAHSGGHGWGLSTAEWAEFTAIEMNALAHSLNKGITAAKKALVHASHNIHDELLHELHVLREVEIVPHDYEHHLERWPIVVFLLSACCCLFTSAAYHLFNCHSRTLNDALLLLDYVGISILIAGSYYPPIYYGFYCESFMSVFYLGAVSILSVASSVVGVYSGLNPSKFWRLARVLCYSANACFGLLPCVHLGIKYMMGEPAWAPAIAYISGMLGIYAIGTVIYTFQFPERYFPGKFDYFLSSHQLWHILVFAAAFLHYFCAIGHFQWRSHSLCMAPSVSLR